MSPNDEPAPLILAAHGTRKRRDANAVADFTASLRAHLPGVAVYDSYVELTDPPIAQALHEALAQHGKAVVVPLLIGVGAHLRIDIPNAIAAGREGLAGPVVCARNLGPDLRLRVTVRQLIDQAAHGWAADEVSVVLVGRGCSVTDANADHVRLGRVIAEEGGYQRVREAFVQVSQPSLPQALDELYRLGARRIVVMPHFLFPGALQRWTTQAVTSWQAAHPDAQARVTGLLSEGSALAEVVADRYREAASTLGPGSPVYLGGLDLRGRRVLVAGGGRLAVRRIPRLLEAGAQVLVVAPQAQEQIVQWASSGRLCWRARAVEEADLQEAWYVLACTNDASTNAAVAAWAQQRRIFCVRGDDAAGGSAWTPASGTVGGMSVAVVASRQPRKAAAARDAAVAAVSQLP